MPQVCTLSVLDLLLFPGRVSFEVVGLDKERAGGRLLDGVDGSCIARGAQALLGVPQACRHVRRPRFRRASQGSQRLFSSRNRY